MTKRRKQGETTDRVIPAPPGGRRAGRPVIPDLSPHILNSMLDAVIVANPDGTVRMMNRAALELLGYTAAEVAGQPVGRFFAEEEEEEEEEAFFRGTGLARLVREGAAREVETTLIARASERVPVVFNGSLARDADGQLLAVVGLARDMRPMRRLIQEAQARAADAQVLKTVAETLNRAVGLQEALERSLEAVMELIGSEAGWIMLLEELSGYGRPGGLPPLAAARNLPPALEADDRAAMQGPCQCLDLLRRGNLQAAVNIVECDRLRTARGDGPADRVEAMPGLCRHAIVPLRVAGRALGNLILTLPDDRLFGDDELRLLTAIGDQIGVAVERAWLFAETRRWVEELLRLHELSAVKAGSDTPPRPTGAEGRGPGAAPESVLQLVVHSAVRLIGAETGCVNLLSPHGEQRAHAACAGEQADLLHGHRLPAESGIHGLAIRTGEPLLVDDLSTDERVSALSQQMGKRSAIVVPLRVGERTIGALSVFGRPDQRPFDEHALRLVTLLADQAALIIENARLLAIATRRGQQLAAVSDIGRRVTAIRDSKELSWTVVEDVCRTFEYAYAIVFLVEGEHLVSQAAFSLSAGRVLHLVGARPRIGELGICGWVVQTGQPLLVPDVDWEPRYYRGPSAPGGMHSALAVPLKLRGEVIGVLDVESDRLDDFDEDDLLLMRSLAAHVSTGLENALLYAQLVQDSAQLQQLSGRIVQAQEEERRRIARELHDEIAQTLTGVKFTLESLIAELPPGVQTRHPAPAVWAGVSPSQLGPRERLGQSVALVEETLAQVGNLSLELRPAMLDDMGLVPALDWYIERFSQRTGIRVTLDSGGLEARLPGEAETAVYRIIQEAMTNAARHAAPRHVHLSLRSDGRGLRVRVEDDGRGFDVDEALNAAPVGLAQRHFGLVGIRERAALFGGQVQIDTSPGRGTRLVVELPGVLPRLQEDT